VSVRPDNSRLAAAWTAFPALPLGVEMMAATHIAIWEYRATTESQGRASSSTPSRGHGL